MWRFYYFIFERSCDVLKSKNSCILLNKNINFDKNGTELKWKIPHTVLESQTLYLSSYKNRNLKGKLRWVGAHERKKRAFFVPFILPEGNFLRYVFISMCCVLNTLLEYTYIHLHIKKNYFIHFCCLFLKLSNA